VSSVELDIVYTDNHLLVVAKPAGLVVQGVAGGRPSLIELARAYLKNRFDKPGNAYVGVVSRLDAPVTGVVVLARTSKAAARLGDQFASGTVDKEYVALLATRPKIAEADCVDWLAKDERAGRVAVCADDTPGAKRAELRYETLGAVGEHTAIRVHLLTGRKHQIRAQLASRGYPIVGDRKYGSRQAFAEGIALHAERLALDHPTTKERLEFRVEVPSYWPKLTGPGRFSRFG
jgi:23S rRNA pseudouridine1911/1915/1917 synthase